MSGGLVVANDPINATDPTGMETVVSMQRYKRHAFVVLTDTESDQESVISRGGPPEGLTTNKKIFEALEGIIGPIKGEAEPRSTSTDQLVMERDNLSATEFGETTIDTPFDEAVSQAQEFAASVNEAEVSYELLATNSNSYAGTQYEQLTGEDRPSPDVTLPGYGKDLCNSGVEC